MRAQSIWNAGTGSWFTPADWTPNGVPTSTTDTQINNTGTAQVSSAGAVARTVFLGNALGDTGHLEVSGAGTLTTNASAGFFLIVGEGGTGTLSISSGGSVSAPVIYFGDFGGSSGTGTVTGAGSLLSGTFDIEVGRSGQGTLNILNGGSVTTSVFAVGNGTGTGSVLVDGTTGVTTTLTATGVNIGGNSLGSTGDVTVTGAKAKFSGGGVDVGSAGNGTLTLSAGATGTATTLTIGDAGTGGVTLTDSGTTFAFTGTSAVKVGLNTTGTLDIKAGATLTSQSGAIGINTGATGTVTITGAGSAWTVLTTSTLSIGQAAASGTGAINVLNGGHLSAATFAGFNSAAVKIDGTGSQMTVPNDFPLNSSFFLGSSGASNTLDVTNGGALATGAANLTTTAGSGLAVNLAGAGSTWTLTNFSAAYLLKFGGAGTSTFQVSDHAALTFAQNGGGFNVDASGAGSASLTVTTNGSVTVGGSSGTLRIGVDGAASLGINGGGTVTSANVFVGEDAGSSGTVTVSGTGTAWNATSGMSIGVAGSAAVTVSAGASGSGSLSIGSTKGTASVTLSGTGTTWVAHLANPAAGPNNFALVGSNGSLLVKTGASITALQMGVSGNGSIIIQDAGTQATNNGGLSLGGTGTVQFLNGATVTGSGGAIATGETDNTTMTVDGAGTTWTSSVSIDVGENGTGALNIQNGAHVSNKDAFLGSFKNADSTGGHGTATVTGAGSTWNNSGILRVGDLGISGSLTVSSGATLTSTSGVGVNNSSIIGNAAGATGTVLVTGTGSSWTNTGDLYIGNNGAGTLTTASGGSVTVTGATNINSASTLNIGVGALSGSFSAASVANSGLIHFNLTDSITFAAPVSGNGAVTKDGAGTTILSGASTYTGATTINAGVLSVNGSLGNTAVAVNNGGALGGSGTITGPVTVANGGILAPGNSPGTITVGALTLNSTSMVNYDLGTPNVVGGVTNDLTVVNGDFTLDGTLNVTGSGTFGIGAYRLFNYTGTLTNNTLNLGTLPGGFTYTIDTSSAKQVNLDVAGIVGASSYWNGSHTSPNGTINGGSGTWNNVTTNWTDLSGTTSGAWIAGNVAHFTGASGTVTLGDNVLASEIQFLAASGAYTITAAPGFTLTINGAGITNNSGITQNFSISGSGAKGAIVFNNSATAGTQVAIDVGGSAVAVQFGGNLSFHNSANAGSAAITVEGGAISAALGGVVDFFDSSSAANATFTVTGISNAAGGGNVDFHNSATGGNAAFDVGNAGIMGFTDNSTAGSAHITLEGGNAITSHGGSISMNASATFGNAVLVENGATVSGMLGGHVEMFGSATAGSATVTVNGGAVSGANGADFEILGTSASTGAFTVNGATAAGGFGGSVLIETGTAAGAHFTINGDTVAGTARTPFLSFEIASTAANAVIVNGGGTATGATGGQTTFADTSTASAATFTNNGGAGPNALGGTTEFFNSSTAASGSFTNNPGTVANALVNTPGGSSIFHDTSTAGSATITNNPVLLLGTAQGTTVFRDSSTAGASNITNKGGALITFILGGGGETLFHDSSTAGSAAISNNAGTVAAAGGGQTVFLDTSHAGSAVITAQGAALSSGVGGFTSFFNNSTADTATLVSNGATIAGATGGQTSFLDSASAGNASVVANGGSGGGAGGTIFFFDDSTGGTATVQVLGNGALDISAHNAPGVTLASIEGQGNVFLGARSLTVTTSMNKTFSGVIQDGGDVAGVGGSFTKDGVGNLILSGASTYTGPTTINGGTVFVNGSLGNTAVSVNGSGTLGGSGVITGPVTVNSGGILAPGNSPGTITVGSLTLNGGAILNYQLATAGVAGGGVNDLTTVIGNVTLGGATINVAGLPGFSAGIYPIITYTGTLTGAALSVGSVPLGFALTVDTSHNHEIDLIAVTGGPLPIAYWNGSNLAPNGTINGGSGTWDNAATNWTDSSGSVLGKWGGAVGIFGGAAGLITLGDNVNFTSLEFVSNGYVINGGSFSLVTTGSATITTDAGVTTTINAPITGSGSLTKSGIGTLYLNGQNTYLGPTLLTGGSLYINGSVAGDVQVLAGLLGGSGRIGGNLLNNGIVSPGNSPGTLRVNGNFSQTAAGTLRAEVGGRLAGQYDVLSIGGHASLDGALQIVQLNGFKLKRGDSLTLLSASQGVSGKFASVTDPFTSNTILQPAVIYTPTAVDLTLVQGSFAKLPGLTPNEQSVAKELDRVVLDPRADKLIAYLDDRVLNKLPRDFDRIAAEELTAMQQISISLATLQSVNIQRRMDDIHSGSNGFSAAGFAMSGGRAETRTGGYEISGPAGADGKDGKAVFASAPDNRWGVFVTGVGQFVDVGNHDFNASGYNIETGGFTLGVDYKVTPHFAVGFSAGYAGTSADLADGGRIFVNGGKLGLYATYFDGGFYANMAVSGGYNSYETRRSALQGDARGSTDGGELNALFATGYDWKKGALAFGPTASFNYTYIGVGDFEERGSLAPLDIVGQHGESLRSALGMKASYDWKVGGVLIRPEVRAAWQHEFGDRSFAIDSRLASGAGDLFSVEGPRLGRDSLLLGAGFAIQWSERLSTYIYYDGELGRENYSSQNISAGMNLAF